MGEGPRGKTDFDHWIQEPTVLARVTHYKNDIWPLPSHGIGLYDNDMNDTLCIKGHWPHHVNLWCGQCPILHMPGMVVVWCDECCIIRQNLVRELPTNICTMRRCCRPACTTLCHGSWWRWAVTQKRINSQNSEDTQVGYISQKYTLDNYILKKCTLAQKSFIGNFPSLPPW